MENSILSYKYDPNGLQPREKKYNWHQEFKDWKIKKAREGGAGARRQLMKKVHKNGVHFYTKLASEKIVSYASVHDCYRFSGSSYDRTLKQLHNEREAKIKKEISEKTALLLFPFDNDTARQPLVADVHCNQTDKPNTAGGMARSSNGKKPGIHVLSVRSKAKIRAKITEFFAYCRRAKKQCTFLTLTFICDVSDGTAIKILNKFLTSVRQEVGDGFQYIRVAERQENGNIHFHLILDRPINIIRFNSLWVLSQYNAGLVGYSKKFRRVIHKEEIEQRHKKTMQLYQDYKHARTDRNFKAQQAITEQLKIHAVGKLLNPVDIKKISTPGTLAGYLTKYVTKNNAQFRCLAWSCSRGVSQLFTAAMVPLHVWKEAGTVKNSYVTKEGELRQAQPYTDEKKMSVTVKIYNRAHFDQYLKEMRTVNLWIMTGQIDFPQVPRYGIDEYLQRIHNVNFN